MDSNEQRMAKEAWYIAIFNGRAFSNFATRRTHDNGVWCRAENW